MAIWVDAGLAIRNLQSAKEQLSERQFGQAVSRGMNEATMQGRTVARKAVKDIYNIPQRYVGGINIVKATPGILEAKIYASATPIPMDAFSPKFQQAGRSFSITRRGQQKERTVKRPNSTTVGVSIEVIKGKRETVPFAFMIAGGKPRVFARGAYRTGSYGFVTRNKRVNKKGNDTPVKPLLSVTVHAAVLNKDAMSKITDKVNQVYPAALQRNVELMVSRVGAS